MYSVLARAHNASEFLGASSTAASRQVSASSYRPSSKSALPIDPLFGVTTWPNDADLAPEALRSLPDEREHAA